MARIIGEDEAECLVQLSAKGPGAEITAARFTSYHTLGIEHAHVTLIEFNEWEAPKRVGLTAGEMDELLAAWQSWKAEQVERLAKSARDDAPPF